eukprot:gene7958-8816_t
MIASKTKLPAKTVAKRETEKSTVECSSNSTRDVTRQSLDVHVMRAKKDFSKLKCQLQEMVNKNEKYILQLDVDIAEKKSLLDECVELNGAGKKKRKSRYTGPENDEDVLMPYDIEAVKKLGRLAGRLSKELTRLRKLKYDYTEKYITEFLQIKKLEDLIDLESRPGGRHLKGRLFFKTRNEDLEKKIASGKKKLAALKRQYQNNLEVGWEKAADKYGEQVKSLTNQRSQLQIKHEEKEEELKEVQARTTLLEQDISTRQSKIERQNELNNNQVYSSQEFAKLMKLRNVLLTRIEKSLIVIEDTKAAHNTVLLRTEEVRENLSKTKTRIEELKTKVDELKERNEEEKTALCATNDIMGRVNQELNAKNGELLKLELDLEGVQNHKNILEKNLEYINLSKSKLKEENEEKSKRIQELKTEYFDK